MDAASPAAVPTPYAPSGRESNARAATPHRIYFLKKHARMMTSHPFCCVSVYDMSESVSRLLVP